MENIQTNTEKANIYSAEPPVLDQAEITSAGNFESDPNSAQAEAIDPEKVYTQTHGDTVKSGNLEDIARKCTGLRGLPTESIAKMIKAAERAEGMRAAEKQQVATRKSILSEPKKTTPLTSHTKEVLPKTEFDTQILQAPIKTLEMAMTAPGELLPKFGADQIAQIMANAVSLDMQPESSTQPTLLVNEQAKFVSAQSIAEVSEPAASPNKEKIPLVISESVSKESTETIAAAEILEFTQSPDIAAIDHEAIIDIEIETDDLDLGIVQLSESAEFSGASTGLQVIETPIETKLEAAIIALAHVPELEPWAELEPMVVIAQAFFEQVAPLVSGHIVEFLTELAPEETAEIVAQIEMLTVVADRLHQLVVEGNDLGEEAVQIEAFLCREYTQLLIKVGIEPTEARITQFMRYIHSEAYNLQRAVDPIEIEDEGTHEKKLFEEASVFAKAQQASIAWKQKLHGMMGRLTVQNLAA